MARKIFTLLLFIPFFLVTLNSFSQCEPLTPEQCPDPENNGQICPDSLVAAFVGQPYSQVATIKPPASFFLPDSTEITLHHVKLMEVANLPEGITWQSNAADSIFIAGEYYCVLMEGTPLTAGDYTLRITVDVYAVVIPGFPPIKVATATDSTSLTLVVIDNSGINDHENASFYIRHNIPNPFRSVTRIDYYSEKAGPVTFEVFNLFGERLHDEQLMAGRGENSFVYSGQALPEGAYYYVLRSGSIQSNGIMVRAE